MNLNIFKATAELKEALTEKATLLEKLQLVEKDLTEAQNTIGSFMTEKQEFDNKLEALKTEHKTALDKVTSEFTEKVTLLETQLAEAKTSTNKEAAQVLASVGIPVDELPKVTVEETRLTKGYRVIPHVK